MALVVNLIEMRSQYRLELSIMRASALRNPKFDVTRNKATSYGLSLSVVLTLAMTVSQAAEGEEAFTLVGSVK